MKPQICLGAVQLTSTTDIRANLERACHWTKCAAEGGAELVVLPENYGFLGTDAQKLAHAQPVEGGAFTEPLRDLARRLEIYVLAGSIPETGPDGAHVYNTSVLIDPGGRTAATYRKIHLFDVELADGSCFHESAHVARGTQTTVATVHGWGVGLSICYDLRFPELYRTLQSQGARLLLVPAAFTLHTGKDHWEMLVRARAIENLCYVAAPGQFGQHDRERRSWGKTMVVDPWGTVLATAPEREGVVLATLDAAAQDRMRAELPCLANRQL